MNCEAWKHYETGQKFAGIIKLTHRTGGDMKILQYKTRQSKRNASEYICEPENKGRKVHYSRMWICRYTAIIVSLSLLFTMQPIAAAAAEPVQKLSLPTVSDQAYAVTADPSDQLDKAKEKAMMWLQEQLEKEPKTDLPNDTLDILQLLRNEGEHRDNNTVCGWDKFQQGKNTDQDARYAAALCDEDVMEEIMERQNPDGGFGLTGSYQSDPLDSMLVLQGLQQCGMWQEEKTLLSYFELIQHEDGGYSYTGEETSDPWLTARIGYEILVSKEGKAGKIIGRAHV